MDQRTRSDLQDERFARKQRKRRKHGGRKKGSLNKATLHKIAIAERELNAVGRNKKFAVDYMDDMIEDFRKLIITLRPWDANGVKYEGYDEKVWFRAVEVFQGFLNMRAPYQSPRLSAVAIMPAQAQQRTTVNVTILNDRGEKVYSDSDRGTLDDGKLIEHLPTGSGDLGDEEAA